MKHSAVPALCMLLAACVHTPVEQPPAQLFSDHLFAAPSERISAEDVFALEFPQRRPAAAERHQRPRAGDSICREPPSALVAPHRPLGGGVVEAVDRHERTPAGEHELEHGDVPAEHPPPERPSAVERGAERPQSPARRWKAFVARTVAGPAMLSIDPP